MTHEQLPTVVEEIMAANLDMTRGMAQSAATFLAATLRQLVAEYGSLEAALDAPGKPWAEIKRELGLG